VTLSGSVAFVIPSTCRLVFLETTTLAGNVSASLEGALTFTGAIVVGHVTFTAPFDYSGVVTLKKMDAALVTAGKGVTLIYDLAKRCVWQAIRGGGCCGPTRHRGPPGLSSRSLFPPIFFPHRSARRPP